MEESQSKVCCEGIPGGTGALSQGKFWNMLGNMPLRYPRIEAAG